jgi:transcriptional regulator with XRE-family HTH domain
MLAGMDALPRDDKDTVFPGFSGVSADVHDIVERLALRRREAGLSQTEVAARMHTSQSAVARLEAGGADVRLSTLQRYADALGHRLQFGVVPSDTRDEP